MPILEHGEVTRPTSVLRVFISSTFEDLKDHREAVFRAVQGFGGYSDDMVHWSADDREPLDLSLQRVRQCDLLVLLVAHRYGSVPSGSQWSVTEAEYRAARQAGIPVHAYFLDESVPWPPAWIDWISRDRLLAFKRLVQDEVTRKLFHSPEELALMVTQALAAFVRGQRAEIFRRPRRRRTPGALELHSYIDLGSRPNVALQIGAAEDSLPLVLAVLRSKDLKSPLDTLAALTSVPGQDPPTALLDAFRQALEQHALTAWAKSHVLSVSARDGTSKEMYVTGENLTSLGSSVFSRILPRAGTGASANRAVEATVAGRHYPSGPALQSVGGTNRFLGISLSDGGLYSVGLLDGIWVEWRPFITESLRLNLPTSVFLLQTPTELTECTFSSYSDTLNEVVVGLVRRGSTVPVHVHTSVSRLEVARLLVRVAEALGAFHARTGRIHGDVKPENILLSSDGPVLIDSFDIEVGHLAPGLTPSWSAPEQVLAAPVDFTTDIYPLGILVAMLIRGVLTGEVRKFKTATPSGASSEHDVFYEPAVFVPPEQNVAGSGVRKWAALVEACLRFRSSDRPTSAVEFAARLLELVEKQPLSGSISFPIAPSSLVVAAGPDDDVVCRLIVDGLDHVTPSDSSEVVLSTPTHPVAPPPPPHGKGLLGKLFGW